MSAKPQCKKNAALGWKGESPTHKTVYVTFITSVMSLQTLVVTVSTLYIHVTSTVTYICDLCHLPMGVTSEIYCKCKYCTFTVTSILAYTLLLTCRLSSVSNTMKPLKEKIYDQGKFVQDMTYLNIKSEKLKQIQTNYFT